VVVQVERYMISRALGVSRWGMVQKIKLYAIEE
jgi:hypothetical protein